MKQRYTLDVLVNGEWVVVMRSNHRWYLQDRGRDLREDGADDVRITDALKRQSSAL